MTKIPTAPPQRIEVVAAALLDGQARLLLQQRPEGKHHAGLWEFPGGKVEQGESHEAALIREIAEELGIAVLPGEMQIAGIAEETASPGDRTIVLFLYTCPRWTGDPHGHDGQGWGWFSPSEAAALPLAPMDRQLLAALSSRDAG